ERDRDHHRKQQPDIGCGLEELNRAALAHRESGRVIWRHGRAGRWNQRAEYPIQPPGFRHDLAPDDLPRDDFLTAECGLQLRKSRLRLTSCTLSANELPRFSACHISHFSISSNRLYFVRRSERVTEPTLIWPAPEATARSARNESSVSPDRAEITAPNPASLARSITRNVSVTVPI